MVRHDIGPGIHMRSVNAKWSRSTISSRTSIFDSWSWTREI